MNTSRSLLFLIPIITLTVIVFTVSLFFSANKILPVDDALVNSNGNSELSNEKTEVVESNEGAVVFSAGVVLGVLVVLELLLVFEVITRKRREKKKIEEAYSSEKKREEIRGVLIRRLDYLLYKYNEMAEATKDLNYTNDNKVYLPSGKSK